MADDLAEQMAALRPRLHRYAARMMGSAFDGEDVVQDAMAKLAAEDAEGIENVEAWMFKVTHSCAIDALRRRRRQSARDARAEAGGAANVPADRRVAVAAALATFLRLPPRQRSVVALTDVLGHSIGETAAILELTEPAVKAALHRARTRLRELALEETAPAIMTHEQKEQLQRYADRFNAHDWDALRAMLADDVRLDLVNRVRISGARDVSVYFTRYQQAPDWHVAPGFAEGRPALLFYSLEAPERPPLYVVLLDWKEGRIAAIRDFHFARYVMDALEWQP